MPLQTTTDCGSETTQLHGMAKALRWVASMFVRWNLISIFWSESFHPNIDSRETPAHEYVRSVHNIAVECSWLRLRLEFGDSAVICFKKGQEDGIYLSHIPGHAYAEHFVFKTLFLFITWIILGNYANGSGQGSSISWPRSLWRVEIHISLAATSINLALLVCLTMRHIAFLTHGVDSTFLRLTWMLFERSRISSVMVMTCSVFLLSLLYLNKRPIKFISPFMFRISLSAMSGTSLALCYLFYFPECTVFSLWESWFKHPTNVLLHPLFYNTQHFFTSAFLQETPVNLGGLCWFPRLLFFLLALSPWSKFQLWLSAQAASRVSLISTPTDAPSVLLESLALVALRLNL